MTKHEFLLEFAGEEVYFVKYNKYMFTYATTLPRGDTITVVLYGGNQSLYDTQFSPVEVITCANLRYWEVIRASKAVSKEVSKWK